MIALKQGWKAVPLQSKVLTGLLWCAIGMIAGYATKQAHPASVPLEALPDDGTASYQRPAIERDAENRSTRAAYMRSRQYRFIVKE